MKLDFSPNISISAVTATKERAKRLSPGTPAFGSEKDPLTRLEASLGEEYSLKTETMVGIIFMTSGYLANTSIGRYHFGNHHLTC